MRISELQLVALFAILKDSLLVSNVNLGGFDREARFKLYSDILDQQDKQLWQVGSFKSLEGQKDAKPEERNESNQPKQ